MYARKVNIIMSFIIMHIIKDQTERIPVNLILSRLKSLQAFRINY